jgi:hypothetical protein
LSITTGILSIYTSAFFLSKKILKLQTNQRKKSAVAIGAAIEQTIRYPATSATGGTLVNPNPVALGKRGQLFFILNFSFFVNIKCKIKNIIYAF